MHEAHPPHPHNLKLGDKGGSGVGIDTLTLLYMTFLFGRKFLDIRHGNDCIFSLRVF